MTGFLLEGYGMLQPTVEEEFLNEMVSLLTRLGTSKEELESLSEDVLLTEEDQSKLEQKLNDLKIEVEQNKKNVVRYGMIGKALSWLSLALFIGSIFISSIPFFTGLLLSIIAIIASIPFKKTNGKYAVKMENARMRLNVIKTRATDKKLKVKLEEVEDQLVEAIEKVKLASI